MAQCQPETYTTQNPEAHHGTEGLAEGGAHAGHQPRLPTALLEIPCSSTVADAMFRLCHSLP